MAEPSGSKELPDWIKKHLARYVATDGEDGYLWDASLGGGKGMVPTLLLTTTGRKSGRELTLPLIFGKSGSDYVVVASKGGAPAHPAWYLNLEANPIADVELRGGEHRNVKARIAEGEERAELWRKVNEMYSGFDDYSARTTRDIRLFVLEPR